MDKKKFKLGVSVDTFIIILIASCILFINMYTVNKLNELEDASRAAIFIKDDIQFIDDQAIGEEIVDYLPGSYKMIELYDENLDLLFQVQFSDPDEKFIGLGDIKTHQKLVDVLTNMNEGQTKVSIDGNEEDVYFKWVDNSRGESRLLIVYNSIKKVKGLWLFSLACYFVLVLVFILLIRMHSKSYSEKINQYRNITKTLRNQLK